MDATRVFSIPFFYLEAIKVIKKVHLKHEEFYRKN